MQRTARHPVNPWIRNGYIADLYLQSLRREIRPVSRILSFLLGTEIACALPKALHLPHPYGIIVGAESSLGENVTLMHQVTLGGKDPWCAASNLEGQFPALGEGVYVGAGAKLLGPVQIGEWAVIGANAVVTKSVPAFATVVGENRIIKIGKRPASHDS